MRHIHLTTTVILLLLTCAANAQPVNVIRQHNSNLTLNIDYTIDQLNKFITIKKSNATETFEFEARLEDNGVDVGPGDIRLIEVVTGVTGRVRLSIEPTGTYTYGAREVQRVDMAASDDAGIVGLKISGNLGFDGNVNGHPGKITVGNTDDWGPISGTFEVDGDLENDLRAGDLRGATIVFGDGSTGGQLNADFTAEYFGPMHFKGTGTHSGSLDVRFSPDDKIQIDGPMSGSITLQASLDTGGEIEINGDFSGSADIENQLAGTVDINGDVLDAGSNRIWVKQMTSSGVFECEDMDIAGTFAERLMFGVNSATGPGQDLDVVQSGTVNVNGTLTGAIYFRAQTDATVTVGSVNATSLDGNDKGGIVGFGGFLPGFSLTVTDDFIKGGVYQQGTHGRDLPQDVLTTIAGTFNFDGDFGSASTTARFRAEFIDPNGAVSACNSTCPDLDLDADITIADALYGRINATGELGGTITAGQFPSSGEIEVGSVASGAEINLTDPGTGAGSGAAGSITVAGNMAGTLDVAGNWQGSLLDIGGNVASTGALLVDYGRGVTVDMGA